MRLLLICLITSTVIAAPVASGDASAVLNLATHGDATGLRAALRAGGDANSAQTDGTSALMWAVRGGHVGAVELLLQAGADVNSANRYGLTALSLASANGDPALIDRLLAAGADANLPGAHGETPIMTAARVGVPQPVSLLIAYGADVNATEPTRGQTALMWAAAENNDEAVRILLNHGADVEAQSTAGFTALAYAVRAGQTRAVTTLLEAGADVNATLPDGTGTVSLAIINVNYEMASQLLDWGADPNADATGWTPLHQVAITRRPNIGGFFNPEPKQKGDVDSLDLVRKLVAYGADLNKRIVKEPRTQLNTFNRMGATPFLLAGRFGDAPMMRLLADLGADPLLTNVEGTTPLMAAAGIGIFTPGEDPSNNEEAFAAVKLAFDLGGDVNAMNTHSDTAMHGAALRGATEIVRFLYDNGANLEVENDKHWTPLTIADGIVLGNTFKRQPEIGALLRELMRQSARRSGRQP